MACPCHPIQRPELNPLLLVQSTPAYVSVFHVQQGGSNLKFLPLGGGLRG